MEIQDEATLVDGFQKEELPEEESLLDLLDMEDKSDESFHMMQTLAKNGDQRGILWMGMYYMQGDEEEQDFAEACYWFCKSNDAAAKVQMAKVYEWEGNRELARQYYQEAVDAEEDSEGTMKGMAHLSLTMLWLSEDVYEAEYHFVQVMKSSLPAGMESHIPEVADVLGRRLFLEKDYERCLAWTRIFLKYEPDNENGKKRLFLACGEGLKAEEGSRFQKAALEGLEELSAQGEQQALALLRAYRGGERDNPAMKPDNMKESAPKKTGLFRRIFSK